MVSESRHLLSMSLGSNHLLLCPGCVTSGGFLISSEPKQCPVQNGSGKRSTLP